MSPLWNVEVWRCTCGAVNAILRKHCRFCPKTREEVDRPLPPLPKADAVPSGENE